MGLSHDADAEETIETGDTAKTIETMGIAYEHDPEGTADLLSRVDETGQMEDIDWAVPEPDYVKPAQPSGAGHGLFSDGKSEAQRQSERPF